MDISENPTQATIFAMASAPGKAGVAVIRISGSQAKFALGQLSIDPLPKARVATLRRLKNINTQEIIDEALVLWFSAPHSYTGEDVAELHIHGSKAVISSLIEYLSSLEGLRMAEAGEFSRRAFENGKMDLTMLEGVADLIEAQTKAQQKQAIRQMSGELERLYESWRENIIQISAHVEAYIDFPDEDIPEELEHDLCNKTQILLDKLQKHLENPRGERLRNGINIIILGAPNVGKSSLINAIAKRDIAIVSDIAGTTRDIIEAHINLNGYPVTFIDTAGLRLCHEKIESQGIKIAKERAKHADIKICMFDAQSPNEPDTHTLSMADQNSVIVMNKCDRGAGPKYQTIGNSKNIRISVKNDDGVDELLSHISTLLTEQEIVTEDPLFTRERHKVALREASKSLETFLISRREKRNIELCAEDLRQAAKALGSITGRIDIEDILSKIFSSFCIGK